ncbi:MAG: tetratricopeptide repeat protein, partial [Candidatus Omnitrophica bacterium]|nr:tetratricopeptide repeat protein [Candidatus Omnitrophota bacterium]
MHSFQDLTPKKILCALLLLLVIILAYSNSFHASFQFDDFDYIAKNSTLRNISDFRSIWGFLSHPSRFLGFMTFALNYRIHKLNVFGYHLTNFFIHLLSVWQVYIFYQHLINLYLKRQDEHDSIRKKRLREDRFVIAYLGVFLFAAHPIQTQAVTYITQRFASMATLFYISAVNMYICHRMTVAFKKKVFFLLLFVCFSVCGMLTKEILITVPIIIVLIEYLFILPAQDSQPRLPGNKAWLIFLLTILILLMAIVPSLYGFKFQNILLAPRVSSSHMGDILTLDKYLLTQARVFMTFLRLFIYPVSLNLDYDFPMSHHLFEWKTFLSLLGVLLFLTAIRRVYTRNRLMAFGLLWFVITFLPNLVPRRHVIFEHKMYLLSIGLCLSFVLGVFHFISSKKASVFCLAVIISMMGILTFQRNMVWHTEISLWKDVIKKSPKKARPYMNLGKAYLKQNRLDSGMFYLNHSIKIYPFFHKALINRGIIYTKRGFFPLALSDFNKAIRLNPGVSSAYNNRGVLYYKMGNFDQSLSDLNQANSRNPNDPEVYYNRAILYQSQKKYSLALEDYSETVRLKEDYAQAYNNRGNIYRALLREDLALKDYNYSVGLDGDNARAYYNRGNLFYHQKLYQNAIADFDRAVLADHHFEKAFYNKGNLHLEMKEFDLALQSYNRAITLNSRYIKAYVNRGTVYFKKKDYDQALRDFSTAIQLDKRYAAAFYNRSVVWDKKGEGPKALRDALQARALGFRVKQSYIDRLNQTKNASLIKSVGSQRLWQMPKC